MASVLMDPGQKRDFMASGNNRGQKVHASVPDPRQNEKNNRGKKLLLLVIPNGDNDVDDIFIHVIGVLKCVWYGLSMKMKRCMHECIMYIWLYVLTVQYELEVPHWIKK